MSVHTLHPDSHTHGLADGCPRCDEHAADPINTLDERNLRRIIELAVHPDRFSVALTETDLVAAAKVLTTLERAAHLMRVSPQPVFAFLSERYGAQVPE